MNSMTKRFVFGLIAASALFAGTYAAQAQSSCPNVPTMNRTGDEEIHGRSLLSIVASLRDQGIRVTNVEAQGPLIKVDVVGADCSLKTEMVDPDTLKPVSGHWQP